MAASPSASLIQHLLSSSISPPSLALALLPNTLEQLCITPLQPHTIPQPLYKSFLRSINDLITSKYPESREVGWRIGKVLVEQDAGLGSLLEDYGQGWIVTLSSCINKSLPNYLLVHLLAFLESILLNARSNPPFLRATAIPSIQKISLSLVGLTTAGTSTPPEILIPVLTFLPKIIPLSPQSLRPLLPQLTTLSSTHLLSTQSVSLYASLHLLAPKPNQAQILLQTFEEVIGSAMECVDVIAHVWDEESLGRAPVSGVKVLKIWEKKKWPLDPLEAIPLAKQKLEVTVKLLVALLIAPCPRALPVPVGTLLSLPTRLLRLVLDTQTAEHADPREVAAARVVLPEIWRLACVVVAQVVICVKQHALPHQASLFSHLVGVLEICEGQPLVQLTVFRTLALFLKHLPPPPMASHSNLPTRATKICLATLNPLLEHRSSSMSHSSTNGNEGLAKGKGKKRSRNGVQVESSGNLEKGTEIITPQKETLILSAIELLSVLYELPALPPSLKTLTTRVLLSLSLSLPSHPHPTSILSAIQQLLSRSIPTRTGTLAPATPWVLSTIRNSTSNFDSSVASSGQSGLHLLDLLVHPRLPPLQRGLPNAKELLFYRREGVDEIKTRNELEWDLAATEDMEVSEEEMVQAGRAIMPLPTTPSVAVIPAPPTLYLNSSSFSFGATAATTPTPIAGPSEPLPVFVQPPTPVQVAPAAQTSAVHYTLETNTAEIEEPLQEVTSISREAAAFAPPAVVKESVFSQTMNQPMMMDGDESDNEIPQIVLGSSDEEDEESDEEDDNGMSL